MHVSEFKKMIKKKAGQTNEVTAEIIHVLDLKGFKAWRNNTTGVFDPAIAANLLMEYAHQLVSGKQSKRLWGMQIKADRQIRIGDIKKILSASFRKFSGEKGVSDIIGIHKKTGRMIVVEVKTGKDKLSTEQQEFIKDILKSKGLACVASSSSDVVEYLKLAGL